jgi:hypothetical protein
MFTPNQQKNKNALLTALLAMAQSVPTAIAAMPNPKPKRARRTKKGRSKANARHIQGAHFKPVYLYEADGKPMPPSMYRRLHLGVQKQRKQNGSQPNH